MYSGWTRYLTRNTIIFIFALFLAFYVVFGLKVYGIEWMLGALIIFILISTGNRSFFTSWKDLPDYSFRSKLFLTSFLIRLVAMFILLAISYQTWNLFYYVGARDEMVYYRVAREAESVWTLYGIREAYNHILTSYKQDLSDTGYSTFLMILMSVFGYSPVIIKGILCAIGSLAVVRGYRLASLVFDDKTAKLAAVFLMLYPISWFYSAIMLKEGIMVLLITEVLIHITKIQSRFRLQNFLIALLLIITLFFFRSAVSILLVMVLGFSLFIQKKTKNIALNIIVASTALLVYIYFLKSTGEFEDYYEQYIGVDEFTEERVSYMKEINPFVVMVGSPVFAVVALTGPFPSVVTVPIERGLSHSEYYYHVAGNLYYIILAFFSLYGLYYAIRYNRQKTAAIWSFALGYQFVLLKAMMFTSVRFAYPAKPFLFIMAAYGIYSMRSKRWYPLYLALAFVMIIGWNYVRLKGRG